MKTYYYLQGNPIVAKNAVTYPNTLLVKNLDPKVERPSFLSSWQFFENHQLYLN